MTRKGIATRVSARTAPAVVKGRWTPIEASAGPSRPLRPKASSRATPPTTGGSTIGRVTSARNLLRALVTLPMVLPPVVGGVALLLAFGRKGLLGPALASIGVHLPFTTAGAVLAETLVAMPFLVITVEAGLRALDTRYEEAARTLGAGRWYLFRRVTLPLLAPSLFAGAVLCWARALGEFGATITVAGNFPGTTQTLPLAVYLELNGTRPEAAIMLSLVLLAVSLAVLIGLRQRWLGAA